MTIAQETTIQAYQLKKGGTRARLAILRMIAADSAKNANPHTRLEGAHEWRKARSYTLGNYQVAYCSDLNSGFEGEGFTRSAVWYSHTGPNFRDEMYCHEVEGEIDHTGWFTDTFQDSMARGIVARLTHGRFIAGYEWDSNGERVYFDAVHDNERDAALMADEHARVFAESAREHDEKYQAAKKIEENIEGAFVRLRECLALRHKKCMSYIRDEALTRVNEIRHLREQLSTEYAGVL